jgi:hypothetical protein
MQILIRTLNVKDLSLLVEPPDGMQSAVLTMKNKMGLIQKSGLICSPFFAVVSLQAFDCPHLSFVTLTGFALRSSAFHVGVCSGFIGLALGFAVRPGQLLPRTSNPI